MLVLYQELISAIYGARFGALDSIIKARFICRCGMGRGPTSQVRVLNQLSIIFGYDCKGIDDYGGCPGILPHG